MADMAIRNLLYFGKLSIVIPVSSTLSKDGLPAPSERVFFTHFPQPKEKTRDRHRSGFPCLLSSQLLGLDFVHASCRQILYMSTRSAAFHSENKKARWEITAGLNPVQGKGGDKCILPQTDL